ncbi:MAG: permease prefix domain 1-containing protein, partial [Thermoanaerobaculia bacterium]|nr:permease prefix domain 1-containing protein [Thermoanaerobaculia bacterium]
MSGLWRWRERARRLLRKGAVEAEVAEEMRFHVEMETRDLVSRGVPPGEAARLARLRFGGVERFRAESRDGRWGAWLDRCAHDLFGAVRSLRHQPTFTAVTVATLALGIGGSTAIFTVVDTALLRPLPYPSPERTVWLQTTWAETPDGRVSPAEYFDYRSRLGDVFEAVGGYAFGAANLNDGGDPERVAVAGMTEQTLAALGTDPILGRDFTREEYETGAAVVLLAHEA